VRGSGCVCGSRTLCASFVSRTLCLSISTALFVSLLSLAAAAAVRWFACSARPLACSSRLLCAAPAAGLLRSPRERGGECATQASCGCASRPGGARPSGCRGGSAWLPDGAWRRPPPFSSSAVAQRTAWGGPAARRDPAARAEEGGRAGGRRRCSAQYPAWDPSRPSGSAVAGARHGGAAARAGGRRRCLELASPHLAPFLSIRECTTSSGPDLAAAAWPRAQPAWRGGVASSSAHAASSSAGPRATATSSRRRRTGLGVWPPFLSLLSLSLPLSLLRRSDPARGEL